MKIQRAVGFAAVAVMAASLAACGGSGDDESASDTYKIMLSGGADAGPSTNQLITGVSCAKGGVDVVNAAGGVNGRQIELIESADNGDPTKALSALRGQLAKDKPDAYMVAVGSNIAAAVAPILNQNDVLFMNSGNIPETGDPSKNPHAFNLAASQENIVNGFLAEFEAKGYKKIGMLNGNSAYAQSFADMVKEMSTDAGYEITAQEYDAEALDMTAQIEKIRSTDPDVLVFNGYGAPVGYVLQGIEKLGWDVPILGDTSVTATPLATTEPPEGLLGTDAVKNLMIQVQRSGSVDTSTEVTKDAMSAILESGTIATSLNNCLNYDAIQLIAAAAESAEGVSAADLSEALQDPDVTKNAETAIYSEYVYSADDHNPTLPDDEHTFVPPSPIVDGQLQ